MKVKQEIKKEIKEFVRSQLAMFIIKKGLTKKDDRIINPFDLLKKIKLASEFASMCTHSYNDTDAEDCQNYLDSEVLKASNEIINFYL